MALRGIKDYNEANRFLKEVFLPWYNEKYSYEVESVYREVPKGIDLDFVFSIRHPRKINKDNTVSFEGRIYQIIPSNGIKSFAGKWVEVAKYMDQEVRIFYDGKRINCVELGKIEVKSKNQRLEKRQYIEDKQRKRRIPPQNHPWRRWNFGKIQKCDISK